MVKSIYKIITTANIVCLVLSSTNVHAQSVPPYIDTTALIAWYPFTGNTNDSSGNNYHALNTGSTPSDDRFGNSNSALNFDGTSSYISATFPASLKTSTFNGLTISSWFKLKTLVGQPQNIILLIDSLEQKTFAQWYDPSVKRAAVCNGITGIACTNYITAIDSPDTSKWYNILLAADFTSPKTDLYINGVMQGSLANPIIHSDIKYLTIGKYQSFWYMNGVIDDIAIWSRSLSKCEIAKQYLSLKSLITKHPNKDSVLLGGSATFQISDTVGSATYQWQENTGSSFANITPSVTYSGVTSKTLVINPVTTAMNNYQYRCLRNGGACVDTSASAKLNVYNSTGIITEDISRSISLFPNPTSNIVEIDAPFNIESLEVLNLLGQLLSSSFPNSQNYKIDLKALPSATYILRVNQTANLRLVKN
ncbi:MAG: LamG-like jellyroll fold domain-containing protein [Chitinophagaceae bacterium]|jgi:hypothetical protein